MSTWRQPALVLTVAVAAVAGVGALSMTNPQAEQVRHSTSVNQSSNHSTTITGKGAQNWQQVAAIARPSVVSIQVAGEDTSGQGSGVVLDNQGHIVTNHHVVGSAGARFRVVASDGKVFEDVELVGTDATTDLAVLKVRKPSDSLKPVSLGDSSAVKVGQPIMAVGNPLGLADTVTTGIVSATDRPVSVKGKQSVFSGPSEPVVTNAIQTDAAINPGNSGGALLNAQGQLIGINSSIYSMPTANGSAGSIGLGFAIPSNEMKRITGELIKKGVATHAWLGVEPRNGVAPTSSGSQLAARLSVVGEGTPAKRANLRVGDYILAIDGEPVRSATSLVAHIRERAAGAKVTFKVLQDGQEKDITVELAARPRDRG